MRALTTGGRWRKLFELRHHSMIESDGSIDNDLDEILS
jgi:hypothetical protein